MKPTTHHNAQTIIIFKSMCHRAVQQFFCLLVCFQKSSHSFAFQNIFEELGAGMRLPNCSGNIIIHYLKYSTLDSKGLVIFKSSQQEVETLVSFVTVHMSDWQSAHSVRQKNLFNVCPTRRHEAWLAESREWLLIMCPNKQFQLLSLRLSGSTLPIQTEVTGHCTTLWL